MKSKAALWIVFIMMTVLGCSSAAFAAADEGYVGLPDKYQQVEGITDDTVMAIDMTDYQVEIGKDTQKGEWNKTICDYRGTKLNDAQVFGFLKNQGINTISVMITVNDEGHYGLNKAMKTMRSAKAAGIKTNAVLTFSDELTYKGHQPLPEGWTRDNAEWNAGEYVKGLITKLEEEGSTPDMITVGNEIDYDFLDSDNAWDTFKPLSTVTKAIRQTDPEIKIAVNVASPQDAAGIEWIVSSADGVNSLNGQWCASDYDFVTVSFYPWDAENGFAADRTYLQELIAKYKEIQGEAHTQPLILNTNVAYAVQEDAEKELNRYDIYEQMDGIYAMMQSMDTAGGMIYHKGITCGGWSSLIADDGCAMPALGLFGLAKAGQTDAVIDPFRYGGEQGIKDLPVSIETIPAMAENSIRGVDVSSCIALEKAGVKFYDEEGNEADLFEVLKDHGVNYIRIRIWNDPKNAEGETYGGGGCDVETGLELARRAKAQDMKVLLCFHYSDFWADPKQQILPKAWAVDKKNPKAIEGHIYSFTKETVGKFVATGADIGMVQVGNEITRGMAGTHDTWKKIWSDKKVSKRVNGYIKAGVKAVREEAPQALVALHLESPDVTKYNIVMDTWKRDGVSYDVLGSSCYPFWRVSTKSQMPANMVRIGKLAAKYGKMFCVMETAWPYTRKDGDGTPNQIGDNTNLSAYALSPQGQVDELSAMFDSIISEDNGLGLFYWEPAWIPVRAGWINWKYNKYIADIQGTGWAAKGADGYFNKDKMYYQGKPAWGGAAWENNAQFDLNGHPLGSMKVYRDTVSKGQEEIVKIQAVNESGKNVGTAKYAKVELGKSREVILPSVTGHLPVSGENTITIEGSKAAVTLTKVPYRELPAYVGQILVRGGNTYQVTKLASQKSKGAVTLIKAKNSRKVTVPASIKNRDKRTYQVTGIKKKAFKGSKAKKVILKTKKLKKSKVKGSLKGSKVKTIKVKVGKKKANRKYVKKYRKIFKKSNSGKRVTVR